MTNDGEAILYRGSSPAQANRSDASGCPPRRIDVAVTEQAVAALELIMGQEGISLTEAVRRLIRYGDFVQREVRENGSAMLLRRGEREREVVFVSPTRG